VRGHLLDDIVLTAEPGPTPLCTGYHVKRRITATAGDDEFVSVVAQALHVLSVIHPGFDAHLRF